MNQADKYRFSHQQKAQIQAALERIADYIMDATWADVREAGTAAAMLAYTAQADQAEDWNYCTPELAADTYERIAAACPEEYDHVQALGDLLHQFELEIYGEQPDTVPVDVNCPMYQMREASRRLRLQENDFSITG